MKIRMLETMHGTESALIASGEALPSGAALVADFGPTGQQVSRPFAFAQGGEYTDADSLDLPALVAKWRVMYGERAASMFEVIED
jgi:hypothetical protein